MALFYLTRVELYNAPASVYSQLHPRMEAGGFLRRVVSSDNEQFQLPDGEYAYYGIGTAQTIAQLAQQIVAGVWPQHTIFVSEVNTWYALNLRPAQ